MKKFTNIIFDAGKVLFYIKEFRSNIIRRVLKSSGYSEALIEDSLIKVNEFDHQYFINNKEIITWEDEKNWLVGRTNFLAQLVDSNDNTLADKLFMLTFDTFQYTLYEETITILESLQKEYTLYVLSNATASLDWAFDYLGLRGYFEKVIISSYTGLTKPDKKIYEYTLDVIGKNAADCIFIDDRIENIRSARDLGIESFHLNRKAGMSLEDFVSFLQANNSL